MRISYFPKQTALDSEPVWNAFLESCRRQNITPVENSYDADAAVIWSVLWNGRMKENQRVWNHYRSQNKPVFVLEVGALNRGRLWKVSVNGINGSALFGPTGMDSARRNSIGINLKPWHQSDEIILCIQHALSQQWEGMPSTNQWVENNINEIRKFTDRKIIIRSHPRWTYQSKQVFKNVEIQHPRPNNESINFKNSLNSAWAIISWNSNPGVVAALEGVPVFVGPASLAQPVGNSNLKNIESPLMPDREQWANDLAYTEWSVDEILAGKPLERLLSSLTFGQ
jgi:hypothetical protein